MYHPKLYLLLAAVFFPDYILDRLGLPMSSGVKHRVGIGVVKLLLGRQFVLGRKLVMGRYGVSRVSMGKSVTEKS